MGLNPLAPEFVPTQKTPAVAASTAAARRKPRRKGPNRPSHAIILGAPADLDALLAKDTSDTTSVTFGESFCVHDAHIARLVDALGPRLTVLRLGSADTGDGVWVTDAAVLHIMRACPALEVLQLAACVGVTDAAFAAAVRGLPKLRELHLTGHDRSSGKLTSGALEGLIEAPACALQKLYITDQGGVEFAAVQRLIEARRGLRVLAGETDSAAAAWGQVLRQMGRSLGDGLYGNLR